MLNRMSEGQWLNGIGLHRGVAIMLIDVLEELLETNEISIPDEDRSGDASEACIYGTTYANLENEFTEMLEHYFPVCPAKDFEPKEVSESD